MWSSCKNYLGAGMLCGAPVKTISGVGMLCGVPVETSSGKVFLL